MKKLMSVIALILLCCVFITGCVNSNVNTEDNPQNTESAPSFDKLAYTAYIDAYGAEYKIFDGVLYARGINAMNLFGESTGDFQEEWFKLADNVVHIDALNSTLVYLTKKGELYGLGESSPALQVKSEENHPNTEYIAKPVLLLNDCKYASVGMGFVIAIKNDNSLWFWGESKNGQSGSVKDEICTPIKIADRIKTAKAFYKNSAWIDEQDNLYICGDNSKSQIGNGEEHNTYWQDYDCIVSTPYLALSQCAEFSISKGEVIVNAKTKDGNEYMWGALHGGTPKLRSDVLPQRLSNTDIAKGVLHQDNMGVIEADDDTMTFYNTIIDEPPYDIPAIYKTTVWDEANEKKLVKSGLHGEMSMIGGALAVSSESDDCVYLISFDTIAGGRINNVSTQLLYDKYAVPVYVQDSHNVILALPNETRELVLDTQTGEAEFGDAWDETKFDNTLACSREDANALALKQVKNGKVDGVSLIYKPDFSAAPLNSTITKARSSYPFNWCWKITVSSGDKSTNIIINANTKGNNDVVVNDFKRGKIMKSKKGKIAIGIIGAIIGVVIVALAAILIINSRYEYHPVDSENLLSDGEKGVLTIYYNTADGMPESETVEYDKYDTYEFPTVEKYGYNFSGWVCNGVFCGDKMTLVSKTAWASPQFEKAYPSNEDATALLFTDEWSFSAYSLGEYKELDVDAVDSYIDGGYKMTVYSKPNFKGKETKVYYSGMFTGHVGSMKIEKVESDGIKVPELTDEARYQLLKTYAPRIWWDENEEYFATTVENAKANLERAMSANGYTYVINEVTTPKYMNDYLYGDKNNAKAYAFATEKEHKYLDLSYFVYTPYNKAKKVAGMEFGNHIGDWEHITVRLMNYTENGENYYRPVLLDYSTHNLRNYVTWDEIDVVDGTHPVGYTAWGSHGMWKDAGVHIYVNAVVVKLTDVCSQGAAWDLWEENQMETYSYDAIKHTGKGIGNSVWDGTFDLDYANPNSGGVTNWGNRGWNSPVQIYPELAGGPSGPEQKDTLTNYYSLNTRDTDKY